jgi:hypothetical protein
MPELLSPRLVARVERSLRKRINIDIHGHLVRAAAHASDEYEFITAAARLLLNPRERELWLLTWNARIQSRMADRQAQSTTTTSPGSLDTTYTSNVDLDTPIERYFPIAPDQLEEIRSAFVTALGPSASELVDNEAKTASSTSELLDRLQTHLHEDFKKERFSHSNLSRLNPSN